MEETAIRRLDRPRKAKSDWQDFRPHPEPKTQIPPHPFHFCSRRKIATFDAKIPYSRDLHHPQRIHNPRPKIGMPADRHDGSKKASYRHSDWSLLKTRLRDKAPLCCACAKVRNTRSVPNKRRMTTQGNGRMPNKSSGYEKLPICAHTFTARSKCST